MKDLRSTSRYVFILKCAVVFWKSSKHAVIAKFTMKSKFIKLDKCVEEEKWLCHFLENILTWSNSIPAIYIHSDSHSAFSRAQSNIYNGKSRYIHRRHNIIRQLISTEIISIDYLRSMNNITIPLI